MQGCLVFAWKVGICFRIQKVSYELEILTDNRDLQRRLSLEAPSVFVDVFQVHEVGHIADFLEECCQACPRGRFEKSEPTIVKGQDLDVPTYLRKNVRVK